MRYRSFRSILPWRVVPPASHKVSRVSWYSGCWPVGVLFVYGGFTFCARSSQIVQLRTLPLVPVLNPGRPKTSGLGSSLFARRYWGNLCAPLMDPLAHLLARFPVCVVVLPCHSTRYDAVGRLAYGKSVCASASSLSMSGALLITLPPAT